MTVRKQDIKKGIVDKMFTAVDHQNKSISMNDTVKVLEGPVQVKFLFPFNQECAIMKYVLFSGQYVELCIFFFY